MWSRPKISCADISYKCRVSAFTLIELLVVLVILGILISIAYPSMSQTIADNRVRSHAEDIVNLLAFARSEAITRGATVSIFNDENGVEGWLSGGAVRADNEMNPIFQVEPFTGSTINSQTRWYQFDDRGISGVINISVTHENASRTANLVASAGGAITLDYSATKNSDNKESQ